MKKVNFFEVPVQSLTMAPILDKEDFETSNDIKVVTSFDQMGLKEDLLRGIYAYSTIR